MRGIISIGAMVKDKGLSNYRQHKTDLDNILKVARIPTPTYVIPYIYTQILVSIIVVPTIYDYVNF